MSSSGRADAVGGVFRAHVATFLAIHGLRGHSVPGLDLPPGVDPVAITFETDDPTDDIKVTMSDGRYGYISAKRKAGNDRHLKSTVQGWVEQLATAAPADLFVLATEEAAGPVRNLEGALRRFRATGGADRPEDRKALGAVEKSVPTAQRDEVLEHARLLQIRDATDSARGISVLAGLAAYIVDGGNGEAAIRVLGDEFARQAGVGGTSTMEDWEATLAAAGIRVIPDATGLPGQRATAHRLALEAYRIALARSADTIDLTLLADDLPPVRVEGLIDQARISTADGERPSDYQLFVCLRRWRRLVLVGSPGSGKTVAVKGIAARCIDDPYAPIPIVVRLLPLLRTAGQGFQLDGLIDACAEEFVGVEHRHALREHLRRAVDAGAAILICDGLDECGAHAPWMAQQLADIFASLDSRNVLVVTTRPSARGAASRMDLPNAELRQPSGLRATTEAILEACADVRAPDDQRDAWLAARKEWLATAWAEHAELMAVPLLANLVTLICADTAEHELPNGRARVLHTAVTRSVERWEQRRLSADDDRPWAPQVTSQMLLDGFITLGRLLDGTATPTEHSALEALASLLRTRWALAPAPAEEVARDVLRFWDERVAVFVVNGSAELTARSKVFVDIAVAMWSEEARSDELGRWLADVIKYTDLDDAIGLAAHMHGRVVDALIELGTDGSATATSLVVDLAIPGSIHLSEDQLARCVSNVAEHVRTQTAPERRGAREPNVLDRLCGPEPSDRESIRGLMVRVCQLPMTAKVRRACRDLVATARLTEDEKAVLVALMGLANAQKCGPRLTDETISALLHVMHLPAPPHLPLIHKSRRHVEFPSWLPRPMGVTEIAVAVIPWLGQIEPRFPGAARWVFDVSGDASHAASDAIRSRLQDAEPLAVKWQLDALKRFSLPRWAEDFWQNDVTLLRDFASLGDPGSRSRVDADLWSLTAAGDLLDCTLYHSVGAGDFAAAFRGGFEDLRRRWLAALARANDIDTSLVAAQAEHVLRGLADRERFVAPLGEDWSVISTRAVGKRTGATPLELARPEQEALLSALTSGLTWLTHSSAIVLADMRSRSWDPSALFDRDLSRLSMEAAAFVYTVAIVVDAGSSGDLAARAARSPDSAYRLGLRGAVAAMRGLDPDGSIGAQLSEDEDLTVRPDDARTLAPAALYWSCLICRTRNGTGALDCVGCEHGTKPGDH